MVAGDDARIEARCLRYETRLLRTNNEHPITSVCLPLFVYCSDAMRHALCAMRILMGKRRLWGRRDLSKNI